MLASAVELLSHVATGATGLGRTVLMTHVTEHPDIAYRLRGGELLLSTGPAFPEDVADLASFADEQAELSEQRVSDEVHRTFTELSIEGADPDPIVRQTAWMGGGHRWGRRLRRGNPRRQR
ncbi:MAG: PucR family transcriptional regulator ligand-binding domain-containing protein [Actinomycetia bacterium]|nr:PucR family transcriptional regulator ligand-binding domain-containing protein [Actinomycetes bacterium]